ncbi:MAG: hypothetical protein U0401_33230 [Anaerolineae bacterium]
MMVTTHIHVRDARDRLIDLLGLGQTYPLRDLAVRDEQLTVAFNTSAKIPIENSQKGVLYRLYYKQELVERTAAGKKGSGVPVEAEGNGETILLETYKIQEDITFEILARKQSSGREAYLHHTATVKVGLDTSLNAWIPEAPLLDPTNGSLTAPRLIPYGAQVKVEIENSQEGVDYHLIYFKAATRGQKPEEVVFSEAKVRGDLHNIKLTTLPVYEDTDIRIRATKTFDPSEHRATQTTLLDTILPLRVRANSALPLSVEPSTIIDFNQPATIKLANTQPSVTYQLYLRAIPDRDFIHQPIADATVIKVKVAGEPDVQVLKPARDEVWLPPEGYVQWGEAQVGTGGDLLLILPALTHDSLIIVQAHKIHRVSAEPQLEQTLPSAVQLEQAAMILVRPNPAPPLRLKVFVAAGQTNGALYVFDGQPGVFYYFRRQPDGADLGLPAYFHQRDDQDARVNKGLGQLTIGVDYVLARSLPAGSLTLAETPPQPPLLETGPLPVDTPLHVRAVKAQTRVAVPLAYTPQIPSGPEIGPEEAVLAYGAKTKIRIKASRAKEWYQLWLNGTPLGDPVKGTGQSRLLDTPELNEDTTFELLIGQSDEPIQVERVLPIPVLVRPNSALQVSAVAAILDYNTATEIQLAASQPGVSYQLLVGKKHVGEPVVGAGNTIALSTGPLTQETTFSIRATKLTQPDISVVLDQQVTLQVRPEAEAA